MNRMEGEKKSLRKEDEKSRREISHFREGRRKMGDTVVGDKVIE